MLTNADRELALAFRQEVERSGLSPEAFVAQRDKKTGDPDTTTIRRWVEGDLPSRMASNVRRYMRRNTRESAESGHATRDDLYADLAAILRDPALNPREKQAMMFDLAMVFRAEALSVQEKSAAARLDQFDRAGKVRMGEFQPDPDETNEGSGAEGPPGQDVDTAGS